MFFYQQKGIGFGICGMGTLQMKVPVPYIISIFSVNGPKTRKKIIECIWNDKEYLSTSVEAKHTAH